MEEDQIREFLEQLDPENKIDESRKEDFINAVKYFEKNPPKDGDRIGDAYISVLDLEKQLEVETDWRKKAAIAAKIISNKLD